MDYLDERMKEPAGLLFHFDQPTARPPFMCHPHILAHNNNGMMRHFTAAELQAPPIPPPQIEGTLQLPAYSIPTDRNRGRQQSGQRG